MFDTSALTTAVFGAVAVGATNAGASAAFFTAFLTDFSGGAALVPFLTAFFTAFLAGFSALFLSALPALDRVLTKNSCNPNGPK